jgi:type I restriction enzyme M protein
VNYADRIETCKIASLDDIRGKNWSLSVSGYMEKAARETVSPAEVRKQFRAALAAAQTAETKLKTLLMEGRYIDA